MARRRRRRPLSERLREQEVKHIAPLWRRSLLESKMRKETTRADMVITALFLIALVAVLVYYLPGFSRSARKPAARLSWPVVFTLSA
jgi:hypothetical protein